MQAHSLNPLSLSQPNLISDLKLLQPEENKEWDEIDEDIMEDESDEDQFLQTEEIQPKENEIKDKLFFPHVRMEFETSEDAFSYFNAYARQRGFGTRRHSSRKSQKTGEIIGRRICFSFEGFQNSKKRDEEKQRKHLASRTGCKALTATKKTKSGIWVVSQVVDDHNHDFSIPSKALNYRSHRNLTVGEA